MCDLKKLYIENGINTVLTVDPDIATEAWAKMPNKLVIIQTIF